MVSLLIFLFETGSHYVAQAGLKLKSPALAFQVDGLTSGCHLLLNLKEINKDLKILSFSFFI
jgi:hypothetical protein